jgi:hypothetical protein
VIVSLGRFFGALFATEPDMYADIPVSKAVTTGGGLSMTGAWGWKVGLETWALDDKKRSALFEWSLQRAQEAAKRAQAQISES